MVFSVSGTITTRRGTEIRAMNERPKTDRNSMLAAMRQTLLRMEQLGVPRHVLLDVLEQSAKELREELKRGGSNGQH